MLNLKYVSPGVGTLVPRSCAGSGSVLTGSVLCIGVLAIASLSRSFATSTQFRASQSYVAGVHCEDLAGSAVAEMEAQVREALRRQDETLTRILAGPDPVSDGALNLSSRFSPRLSQAGADDCSLQASSCQATRGISIAGSNDRLGMIVFRATAATGVLGHRTVRTVEKGFVYKTVMPALPAPLNQYGIVLADRSALGSNAAINRRRETLIESLRSLRQRLEEGARVQQGTAREGLLDLLDDIPDMENAESHTPMLPEGAANEVHSGLCEHEAQIDGVLIDLDRYLAGITGRAEELIRHLPPATATDLKARLMPVCKEIDEGLFAVWAARAAFTSNPVKASKDPEAQALRACLNSLDPDYFRRRAFLEIGAKAVGPGETADVPTRFQTFLKRGPARGIVIVDNDQTPIELNGFLGGPLMVVTGKGGANLSNVVVRDSPDSFLTVVSFGGPIRVRGRCQAFLLAGKGSTVVLEPGATLSGGLAMMEMKAGTRLDGIIVRDDGRLVGSESSESCVTAISPFPAYRKVSRK
jgi:hypothetical protein